MRGWPRGRVVKFAHSTAGGPVFRWFESWARTWHCSSNHAEAVSHMPQLEGPTTKNIQLCTRGLWREKGKNKIFKKKKKKFSFASSTSSVPRGAVFSGFRLVPHSWAGVSRSQALVILRLGVHFQRLQCHTQWDARQAPSLRAGVVKALAGNKETSEPTFLLGYKG